MAEELLVAWLNDAHAMEQAQLATLERFVEDFNKQPEIRSELRQHLLETQEQITDIKEAIESLGGTVLNTQSILGTLIGTASNISSGPYHDEPVKNMQTLYAIEHFEHICYMAIAEGARHIGEDEIADMCERIAEEEKAMAEWVEEQLPNIVSGCVKTVIEEEQ
jgi:ferritin-like metal-binding protein YciE